MAVVDAIDHTSNVTLRANALGIFQSNVGLLANFDPAKGKIAPQNLNESWQKVINPFARGISSQPQLFDAAESSIQDLWRAAAGRQNLYQAEVIFVAGWSPKQSQPDGANRCGRN